MSLDPPHVSAPARALPTIGGLALVLAVFLFGSRFLAPVVITAAGDPQDRVGRFAATIMGSHVAHWLAVALAIAVVLLLERRGLDTLGMRRPSRADFGWLVVLGVALLTPVGLPLVGGVIGVLLVRALASRDADRARSPWVRYGVPVAGVVAVGALGLWLTSIPTPPSPVADLVRALPLSDKLLLVVTAGVTEEIVYRGYLVERLQLLTGRLWVGLVTSGVAFTLAHVDDKGLLGALTGSLLGALVFVTLYAATRNVWACAILHTLADSRLLLAG